LGDNKDVNALAEYVYANNICNESKKSLIAQVTDSTDWLKPVETDIPEGNMYG